jgi:hypothetical protein
MIEDGMGDDAEAPVLRPYQLEAPTHVTETSLCLSELSFQVVFIYAFFLI